MRPLQKGSVVGSRRGRTIATASIGVAALVGAMATALPAAAASNGDLTVTVNDVDPDATAAPWNGDGAFPDQTVAGQETEGAITIENAKGSALTPGKTGSADNDFAVQVTLSGPGLGTTFGNGNEDVHVDLTNVDAALNFTNGSANKDNSSTVSWDPIALTSGDALSTVIDATDLDAVDGLKFGLTATGTWTGKLTTTVKVVEIVSSSATSGTPGDLRATLATESFDTNVAAQKDPVLADDNSAPAVQVRNDYSFDTVKDAGVNNPAATFTLTAAAGTTEAAPTIGTADDDGNVSVETDAGNKFTFNEKTGVLTGEAADTTHLNYYSASTAYALYTVTPSVGTATTTFTLPVLFVDNDSINSTFVGDVYNGAMGVNQGIGLPYVEGDTSGNFNPANNVTRGQFAAYLYRAQWTDGSNDPGTTCKSNEQSGFNDVSNSSVFCEAVRALAADGVINGTTDTTFDPGAPITRAQIATLIYRANALKVYGQADYINSADKCTSDPFTDVSQDFWSCAQINWASTEGVTTGDGNGNFLPGSNSTRQVTVTFLERALAASLI